MSLRNLAAVLAVLTVAAATFVPRQATLASWTDAEHGSGSFTARIRPPTITSCTLDTGLLGLYPVVTLKWKFPTAPPTYSTPGNVNYYAAAGSPISNPTQVFPGAELSTTGPSSGVYTTQYGTGLLSGVLGGSVTVYLQTADSSGWLSAFASATASATLAGLFPTCVIN